MSIQKTNVTREPTNSTILRRQCLYFFHNYEALFYFSQMERQIYIQIMMASIKWNTRIKYLYLLTLMFLVWSEKNNFYKIFYGQSSPPGIFSERSIVKKKICQTNSCEVYTVEGYGYFWKKTHGNHFQSTSKESFTIKQ